MCETRDPGRKLPHWHTLIFEGEVRIDMRYVCPKDVKKILGRSGQQSMNMKNLAGAGSGLAAKEDEGKSGLKSIESGQKIGSGRRLGGTCRSSDVRDP